MAGAGSLSEISGKRRQPAEHFWQTPATCRKFRASAGSLPEFSCRLPKPGGVGFGPCKDLIKGDAPRPPQKQILAEIGSELKDTIEIGPICSVAP